MDLAIDTTDDLGHGGPSRDLHPPTLLSSFFGYSPENGLSRFQSDLRRRDKDTLSMDLRGILDFPELATPTTIPSEVGMVSQEKDIPADDEIGLEAELMALLKLIDSGEAWEGIAYERKSVASMLDELRDITGRSAPPVLLPDDEDVGIDDIWIDLIDIYVQQYGLDKAAPYADRGLRIAQRMLERKEESDEMYYDILLAVATAYKVKFSSNLFRADIDAAISTTHLALKWVECNDEEVIATEMKLLSDLYSARSNEFWETKDRDYAIQYAREALRLENGGQETRTLMFHLGGLLNGSSVEGERDEGDKLIEQAFGMCWPEDEDEEMEKAYKRLMLLRSTLERARASLSIFMYDLSANTAPLEAEIKTLTEDLAAYQPNSAEAMLIGFVLGLVYWGRSMVSGNAYHIDKAVDYYQMFSGGCGGTNTNTGGHYSTLSSLLMTRYERMGVMEDMDLAIITARQALDCAPIGSQYRPQYMIGLSQLLIVRFERLGLVDNLYDAINLAQVCVDTADFQRIAFCRHILAKALYLHHKTFPTAPTSLEDLDRAIILAQTTIDKNDNIIGSVDPPEFYYSLALFLRTRYHHSREDLRDIDHAIEVLHKGIGRCHKTLGYIGTVFELLGHCHLDRYHALNKTGIDEGISFQRFLDSWTLESTTPLVRIRSGQKVAEFYYNSGKKTQAAEVYEECVKLMTQVSRPFLSRVDQQRLLKMLAGVASQAATYSLEAGKGATHALTLLELGRGIIVSFLIDCRSDMTDLLSEHPEHYQRFMDLRKQMEGVLATPVRTPGFELIGPDSVLAQRKRATVEFERLMERIRALPGHESFLAQGSGESLMALAGGSGHIVVVNAIETRCDAIMITGTSIESIKLDKWEWERANKLLYGMKDLVKGDGSTYATRQREMRELLIWLWDVVVSPILAALGITAPPPQQGGELPQIWWIGTGPMGLAPFHAAGHHMKGSTENTISRAISSYTPNIKALEYSRQRPVGEIRELLLLTMQKTEGQGDLDGVMDEVKQIIKVVEPKVTTKQLEYPTPQEVLSSLEDYQAIHFACHGVVDTANPSGGGLLLQGGRLTVADVAAKRGSALIAYLSACSTAETGDIGLVDEGITLAGAFQMAGFRHVLATMWEGDDRVCTKVAECFYAGIAEGRGVARALHDAVVKARGDKRAAGKVLDWAPFIHNGA